MIEKDNQQKFNNYRNVYQTFYYDSFIATENDENIELTYLYRVDQEKQFKHVLRIKKNLHFRKKISDPALKKIAAQIGIVEGINYYKAFCPKEYKVCVDQIEDKAFWSKLFYNGLSEMLYLNHIQVKQKELCLFSASDQKINKIEGEEVRSGNLIPIGGGKDSITSLGLLKEEKETNLLFIVNPREASLASARTAGYLEDQVILMEREIDQNLLTLNKEGCLNGHVPFSAILSFLSLLVAEATGKKYIVLSNEASANEETVKGANHQYSKTYAYEKDFREYVKNSMYVQNEVAYFSLLRPLHELQIMRLFIDHPTYFKVFKSCNVGSRIEGSREEWCGHCPKCLFVFILFSYASSIQKAIEIFGTNMLDHEEMIHYLDELIGKAKTKPFECIGTKREVNACLTALSLRHKKTKNYLLLNYYETECKSFHISEKVLIKILKSYDKQNFLPPKYDQLVRQMIQNLV